MYALCWEASVCTSQFIVCPCIITVHAEHRIPCAAWCLTPHKHKELGTRYRAVRGEHISLLNLTKIQFVKDMFCPRHISYFFLSRYLKRQALDNPPPPR